MSKYSNFCHEIIIGNIEEVKRIYSLGIIDIHRQKDEPFRLACSYDRLEIAKWLYSLGDVDIYTGNNNLFRYAIVFSNIEIARYLHTLDPNIYRTHPEFFYKHCIEDLERGSMTKVCRQ